MPALLNARLYRAAWLPAAAVFAVAALSLTDRTSPLAASLAPNAFEGSWAVQQLQALSREFPSRPPGGPADDALARRVARTIEGLGPPSSGGFHVRTYTAHGQTIVGERSLETVVASRPGTTSEAAIVVIAHRDSAWTGSQAELTGTAVLLELARALSTRATNRTVALVSTSGGSGGDAGASAFAGLVDSGSVPWLVGSETGAPQVGGVAPSGPVDAAIVLGNLAAPGAFSPEVLPYSSGVGSASTQLAETVANAIAQQAGVHVRSPDLIGQLVHLAAPLTTGEQGPLNAAGVPAVTIQAAGEGSRPTHAAVSAAQLEGLGGGTLSTVEALDNGRDIAAEPQTGLVLAQKVVPGWAIRLLVAALLVPGLAVSVDAAARSRRRRESLVRGFGFPLTCALPFLAAALVVLVLGALGLVGPAPQSPAPPGAIHIGVAAFATTTLALGVLGLGWLLWARFVGAIAAPQGRVPPAAAVGLLLLLDATAVITWIFNPLAAALLVPAVHLWMLVAEPELRPRWRLLSLAVVLLGICAPALVVVYYAHQLALGTVGSVWTGVLLIATGHFGLGTVTLWCVALGCTAAAAMLALSPSGESFAGEERLNVSIRGPLSYAGPGSLGGTESALRR